LGATIGKRGQAVASFGLAGRGVRAGRRSAGGPWSGDADSRPDTLRRAA